MVAVCAWGCAAAPASAGTVRIDNGSMVFVGGGGESNALTLTYDNENRLVRFRDTGVGSVTPGEGCALDGDGAACPEQGAVVVRLADGNDSARLVPDDIKMVTTAPDFRIDFDGGTGDDAIESTVPAVVLLTGNAGDDQLTVGNGRTPALLGGEGNDRLTSSAAQIAPVLFEGEAGDDTLVAASRGADVLHGGPGADSLGASDFHTEQSTDVYSYSQTPVTVTGAADDLSCGDDADTFTANANDRVDATCEPPADGSRAPATATGGAVVITRPGGAPASLLPGELIPEGSTLDATKGRVQLVVGADTGTFYDGKFVVEKLRDGATPSTVVSLVDDLGCSDAGAAAAKKKPKRKKRRLWGDAKGKFETVGRYGSAVNTGTKWLMEDTCEGTTFRVERGRITVRDRVKRKSVKLAAGQSYTAKPKARLKR